MEQVVLNTEIDRLMKSLPGRVYEKVFSFLSVSDLLNCRVVCKNWDQAVLFTDILFEKSCFKFDGRKDDTSASKCSTYMEGSETKNGLWCHLRIRWAGNRQINWVNNTIFTSIVTTFELHNCTLNWAVILNMLLEFDNLAVFIDSQDTYCWDYATFVGGLEENEILSENANFQRISNVQKIESLKNIKIARIHRSQLAECTIYLKIFLLGCKMLQELEVTTDQNFQPQRAAPMFTSLALLANQNNETLKKLTFPFSSVSTAYDFRITDEQHIFREFLNFIVTHQWHETLQFSALEELSLQFGIVPLEGHEWRDKLLPFIQSLPRIHHFHLGCVFVERGKEEIVEELLAIRSLETRLGVFANDSPGTIPVIGTTNMVPSLQSLSIQTCRNEATEIGQFVPFFGLQTYDNLKEFQYFSKSSTFKNFNVNQLTFSFTHLTHLNLVDHNARIETRHSSEALATIEDQDMQLIVSNLNDLVSFQIVGNLTYLTDSGMTGIKFSACRRMLKQNSYIKLVEDCEGFPISNLKNLRSLVFRGVGIKITDVTAYFAFNGLLRLKKLYMSGCHQIDARNMLAAKYPSDTGCELQI